MWDYLHTLALVLDTSVIICSASKKMKNKRMMDEAIEIVDFVQIRGVIALYLILFVYLNAYLSYVTL